MLKVILIGTGNISKFLFDVFISDPSVEMVQVVGRNEKALEHFSASTPVSNNFENLKEADVCIIAVNDNAIEEVSHRLNIKKGILVHTAGSISIEVLPKHLRRGVLYPLQTLSGIVPEKRREIPICVEAIQQEDYEVLHQLARCISDRVERIDSEQRKQLHLAAVFANNFSNHMYFLASEICKDHEVPFDLLRPLIRESCNKIMNFSPYEVQTGPARRGDVNILEEHLNMLNNKKLKEVYTTLSESIQETYGKKL
ncbi:Rossmann-like and DUF2520 domain-containing protein [Muriicola soli]|uniref:DUF2520 domain-containing protein n=1 Tax=Muriicola soli TaxID=2507538 RepID=A0A411E8T3_9FLAO|nr:Rossmann-like and DUF2520 domain-containing protein [Muriicola soli]QBA63943.1 DUF2520 domain-containing protein [Muriicola soli]